LNISPIPTRTRKNRLIPHHSRPKNRKNQREERFVGRVQEGLDATPISSPFEGGHRGFRKRLPSLPWV